MNLFTCTHIVDVKKKRKKRNIRMRQPDFRMIKLKKGLKNLDEYLVLVRIMKKVH